MLPAGLWAATGTRKAVDSGWIKGIDTTWHNPFWSGGQSGSNQGTGISPSQGMGGSGWSDTGYLRGVPLWSSPYEGPATPGTGLPGKAGSDWPATGSGGGSGNGGSGMDGKGIPRDSVKTPQTGPTPATPGDTIGAHEWMERG